MFTLRVADALDAGSDDVLNGLAATCRREAKTEDGSDFEGRAEDVVEVRLGVGGRETEADTGGDEGSAAGVGGELVWEKKGTRE